MASTTSAFFTSETDTLERKVEIEEESEVTLQQIWNDEQSKQCIEWICKNGYQRVCLQFPDSYLKHSDAISSHIKRSVPSLISKDTEIKVFILADTSYLSCCVDEIAAAHVNADCLVHFGNACRSKVLRLPVYYCFPQFDIDMKKFDDYLLLFGENAKNEVVTIYFDIGYHYILKNKHEELKKSASKLNTSDVQFICYLGDLMGKLVDSGEICTDVTDNNQSSSEMSDNRICLFVGSDNQRFFNLSLTTKAAKWFIYDCSLGIGCERNPLAASFIRRRYYYIEKCKDALTLGLVVATLTTDGYLDVIKRLQLMAKTRGIKTQVISVGRINIAKLANFLEIDCFVLIGCPFNNVYESKEFYRPIVSVFEAEMALNPSWYMRYPELYVLDFKELLPAGKNFLEFNVNDSNQEDISLLTGRIRNNFIETDVEPANLSALTKQQQELATQPALKLMTTNTGLTLEDRTWQGLDPALGQTEPSKLQKGLSGIPIRYIQP